MRKTTTPKYYTISIIEPSGARHYELHYTTPQLIRYGVLTVILLLITSIYFIDHLHDRVQNLKEKKRNAYHQLAKVMEENGTLNREMSEKLEEFESLDGQIASLEGLMGVDAPAELSLAERMEQAGRMITQREQEFKEIDNKVQNLENMIGLPTQDEKPLLERVDLASINAALKRHMLDSIPSGMPIKTKGISGKFGLRTHPILKKKEYHPGMDMRASVKTPVMATADGVVESAGANKGGYGNLLIIRHNYGFKTYYGHLDKILVKDEDFIKKGDVVALSGNTGLSSGPHLHYEVQFVDTILDPEPFVEWDLDNYEGIFQKERRVKWQSLINLINRRLTQQTQQSLQVARKSEEK